MSHITATTEPLTTHHGVRLTLQADSGPMTFAAVIDAWRIQPGFRAYFTARLAECPYVAFRWETPAVTAATASRPFECVLLDSPALARPPNPDDFAEHFQTTASVVTFANLGRDATLVVPCPRGPESAYGHLAAFVREAPAEQQDALWQQVGEAMTRRTGTRPVWLSTAGAGVPWLHVRLDDRPKYYGYEPYSYRP